MGGGGGSRATKKLVTRLSLRVKSIHIQVSPLPPPHLVATKFLYNNFFSSDQALNNSIHKERKGAYSLTSLTLAPICDMEVLSV